MQGCYDAVPIGLKSIVDEVSALIREPDLPQTRQTPAATGLMIVGILAWLWPIGLGGRMPVGGDVTQFSIGLMAEFGRAIRSGRIPYWNDLWGFGFPGLAESQMGVYYPPHLACFTGSCRLRLPTRSASSGIRSGRAWVPPGRRVGSGRVIAARHSPDSRSRPAASSSSTCPISGVRPRRVGCPGPGAWPGRLAGGSGGRSDRLLLARRPGDPGLAGTLPARVHHRGIGRRSSPWAV